MLKVTNHFFFFLNLFFDSFSEKTFSLSFVWFIRRHRHCCIIVGTLASFSLHFPHFFLLLIGCRFDSKFKIQEFGKSKKRKDSSRPDTNKLRAHTQLFSVTTKRIFYLQCDYQFYFINIFCVSYFKSWTKNLLNEILY